MRVPTMEVGEEMVAKMLALTSSDPDVKVKVEGELNRPPYVKDAGIAALFETAKEIAAEIGFELKDVPITGGGSDGNFTAALGIPTLDGLGADGVGAHTDYEHIYYSSLAERAKLLQGLFERLT
jgi:glutamate carboxypeptidase